MGTHIVGQRRRWDKLETAERSSGSHKSPPMAILRSSRNDRKFHATEYPHAFARLPYTLSQCGKPNCPPSSDVLPRKVLDPSCGRTRRAQWCPRLVASPWAALRETHRWLQVPHLSNAEEPANEANRRDGNATCQSDRQSSFLRSSWPSPAAPPRAVRAQGSPQPSIDLPAPYGSATSFGQLPAGRAWGGTTAVAVDRDGKSVWVFERCGGASCANSNLPPILHFDPSGKLLASFGAGMFVFPHGITVDHEGNVWVADADGKNGKGHQVVKFSPTGKVLMTLGKAGMPGDAPGYFNRPTGVAIARNGDIFVADGHGGDSNARVVKFSKTGKFMTAWGKKGTAAGEFDTPHAIAVDSQERVYVADRSNDPDPGVRCERQIPRRVEAVRPPERGLCRCERRDLCR